MFSNKILVKILGVIFFVTYFASVTLASEAIQSMNPDGLKHITPTSECGDDVKNVNSYRVAYKKWKTLDKLYCLTKHEKCIDSMKYGDECYKYNEIIALAKGDPESSKNAQEWIDYLKPQKATFGWCSNTDNRYYKNKCATAQ